MSGDREKIYIAGKITGTNNFVEKFATAEQMLNNIGFEAVNPKEFVIKKFKGE